MIKGLRGEAVTQCAYVESGLTEAPYFASPCKFGPNGVEEVMRVDHTKCSALRGARPSRDIVIAQRAARTAHAERALRTPGAPVRRPLCLREGVVRQNAPRAQGADPEGRRLREQVDHRQSSYDNGVRYGRYADAGSDRTATNYITNSIYN